MSRPVLEKIAAGETLDDDDIQYAKDRGIAVPGVYAGGVAAEDAMPPSAPGVNPNPVVAPSHIGTAPVEEEVEIVDLDRMTKKELFALAEEKGIDAPKSATKDELISLLSEDVDEEGDQE